MYSIYGVNWTLTNTFEMYVPDLVCMQCIYIYIFMVYRVLIEHCKYIILFNGYLYGIEMNIYIYNPKYLPLMFIKVIKSYTVLAFQITKANSSSWTPVNLKILCIPKMWSLKRLGIPVRSFLPTYRLSPLYRVSQKVWTHFNRV